MKMRVPTFITLMESLKTSNTKSNTSPRKAEELLWKNLLEEQWSELDNNTFYNNKIVDENGKTLLTNDGERVIAINVGKIFGERSGSEAALSEALSHEIQHVIQRLDDNGFIRENAIGRINPESILKDLRNNVKMNGDYKDSD